MIGVDVEEVVPLPLREQQCAAWTGTSSTNHERQRRELTPNFRTELPARGCQQVNNDRDATRDAINITNLQHINSLTAVSTIRIMEA
jgi:hypothetical protein